jgi:hypothetical protein
MVNQSQIIGIVRQLVGVATAWAMGKGYIGNETAAALLTLAVAGVNSYFIYGKASPTGQAQAVTDQGMTVVAPPKIADAMPDNAKVLSSADVKVVSK